MAAVLSLLGVLAAGIYFVSLAVVTLAAPTQAVRFLQGFARSAPAHYLELFLRFVAGGAFVVRGPVMLLPQVFVAIGWLLIISTAVLCLVPWQWHCRFAQKTVPRALRFLPLVALASLGLGAMVILAALVGPG